MATEIPEKGDQVSWKWSGSRPSGEVAEVKEGDLTITSNRGNDITRHGKPGDPAVHVARSGNDVVKTAHELTIEEKANGSSGTSTGDDKGEKGDSGSDITVEANGNAKAGDKHERDGTFEQNAVKDKDEDIEMGSQNNEDDDNDGAEDDDDGENDDPKTKEPVAKKQKTTKKDSGSKEDGEAKGKRGRPKKSDSTKGPVQKKQPKSAATEDGKPRRSSRLAS